MQGFDVEFAVWSSTSDGPSDITLESVRGAQISMSVSGKKVVVVAENGKFFIESSQDARFADLNSWLLCASNVAFADLLDEFARISKKKPRTLQESIGSLSGVESLVSSAASLSFEEENEESRWHLGDEEKAILLSQVHAAESTMQIVVNEDLASIVLTIDGAELLASDWREKFQLSDEKVLITLWYDSPVCPTIRVAQYKTKSDSEGLILIRAIVEHFFTTLRVTNNDFSVLRPLPFAIDHAKVPVKKVGGSINGDSVKNLFMSSGSPVPCDEKSVNLIIGMGFSKAQAIRALISTNNNVEGAIDMLVNEPPPEVERFEFRFFFV
jgi:hypothetical protein